MSKAIKVGRLKSCIERTPKGVPKIRSTEEADDEWARTTRPQPAPFVDPGDRTGGPFFTYAEEAAREKHWRANLSQLEYETKSELLIPADEVRGVVIDRFTEVRTKLLGLPVRIKQRLPSLTAADVRVIDALVREALEAIVDGD